MVGHRLVHGIKPATFCVPGDFSQQRACKAPLTIKMWVNCLMAKCCVNGCMAP